MSVFDILTVFLFAASIGVYVSRMRHEAPSLKPYGLILFVCVVCRYLGEHGGGAWAVGPLVAASFLLLHVASQPYVDRPRAAAAGDPVS